MTGETQIRVPSAIYQSGDFTAAYEEAALVLGRRPSCHVRPGEPGRFVVATTMQPEVIRRVILVAETETARLHADAAERRARARHVGAA